MVRPFVQESEEPAPKFCFKSGPLPGPSGEANKTAGHAVASNPNSAELQKKIKLRQALVLRIALMQMRLIGQAQN